MMPNDAELCSFSTYLMRKMCLPQEKFFDTDFIRKLNDVLRNHSIGCAMTIFDETATHFKALLWGNLEELDPPYKKYIESDSFQQYVRDTLKNSEQTDAPFQIFLGRDFYPDNNNDIEPLIGLLQSYYPNLDIKYSAKVPLGKHKNYWLNLFKKEASGDFSKDDVDYINYICEIIVSAYNAFEFHHSNIEKLESINNAFDYFGAGLATFDKDYKSLSFMGLSNDIIHSITGCVRKTDALDSLLKQIRKTGIADNNIISATIRNYKCFLDEPRTYNSRGYVLLFPHAPSVSDINSTPAFEMLTEREKEVAMCLASGLSYKDISEELFISISTVRNHVTSIYRKLNINNQRQLISLYFGKTKVQST